MNFRYTASLLFFICLVTRLCFVGRYLDSCDSVDFALGLRDYDLSILQPHFPGYPVYIFTSWLFSKLFHHEVWALVIPGVLFGSLTIYPLSLLTRQLFSERVAILTATLYLVNPLCWLQAERPTSDAMGIFFVMLSAYLLYRVFDSKTFTKSYLFFGSLTLGFGLGIRLSYFPFICLWMGILLSLTTQSIRGKKNIIVYGLMGFVVGVCSWLFLQITYVGWQPFLQNGLSFSRGHFTDWGGSVITFGGLERFTCLARSIGVYGLGAWWYGFSFLRLIPSFVITISLLYSLNGATTLTVGIWEGMDSRATSSTLKFLNARRYCFDRRGWFLVVYGVPYILWVILGQNVANPRHVIPVIPIILMLVSYGLCKIYGKGAEDVSRVLPWKSIFFLGRVFSPIQWKTGGIRNRRCEEPVVYLPFSDSPHPRFSPAKINRNLIEACCALPLTLVFIVSTLVISLKLVIQYHAKVPAPIQLIQFIEGHFDSISTRIYCGEEKRFFDYYAPLWDVRKVRDAAGLDIDLLSSLCKPQNVLLVHTTGEIKKFIPQHPPIIIFDKNPYTDSTKESLLLYTVIGL